MNINSLTEEWDIVQERAERKRIAEAMAAAAKENGKPDEEDGEPDDLEFETIFDDNDATEALQLLEEVQILFHELLRRKHVKDARVRGRLRALEFDIEQFTQQFDPDNVEEGDSPADQFSVALDLSHKNNMR